MSDNQIDPEIAVEVFILEPVEPERAGHAAIEAQMIRGALSVRLTELALVLPAGVSRL